VKSFNHRFIDTDSLIGFISGLELSANKCSDVLVSVYSGVMNNDVNHRILNLIQDHIPTAKIIGCTTAGEILENEVLSEQIVISIQLFEKTIVKTSHISLGSPELMRDEIGKKLIQNNSKGLLMFPVLLNTTINIDGLLKQLYKEYAELPVFGGGAGDNSTFNNQYIFCGTRIYSEGIVAASYNSDSLLIETDHSFNWQPIGNELTVTRTHGHIIEEIDFRPALEIVEEYLGDDAAKLLPSSSLEFPMVFKEDDMLIARIITGVMGKSLIISAPIENNSKFQFSFGVREKAIQHANSIAINMADRPVESIMTFSCIARLNFLQKDASHELVNFSLLAPVSGFFTYGEIFHSPGENNYFMNETLTLVFFNENPGQRSIRALKKTPDKQINPDADDRILKVLTHLTSKVTHQLESKNKELNNAYSILLDYNRIIDDKNFEIRKSMRYASSLQQIIMDNILDFSSAFEDYFLLYQPKEIVSGDFYFVKDLGDKVVLAVADATGHGVPGAFISILGMRLMEEITDNMKQKKIDIDAGEFLNILRDKLKLVFKRNTLNKYSSDGLDISIAIIDKEKQTLNFSSANQTGVLYSNGEIIQLKGDRMPIGVFVLEDEFTNLSLSYNKGDCLFLFTDGYADQFGGPRDKKINQARLRNIILKNAGSKLQNVEVALDEFLTKYRGNNEQTDDILIMGVKF
jgi:serine phosphatase RsbU (regulator of sigma subunit)